MSTSRPLPDTPGWRLAAALARLDRAQRAVEAGAELGVADGRLLWLFSDRRPRTLRQVSEDLGLEQSTVNRQVNAALSAGLLRRFREPGGTAYLVEATEDGLARFDRNLERHLGLMDTALAALPESRRAAFPGLLATFVEAYGAAAAADQDPETVARR
jgi:DNA-binding MarR family transcriptional regulator